MFVYSRKKEINYHHQHISIIGNISSITVIAMAMMAFHEPFSVSSNLQNVFSQIINETKKVYFRMTFRGIRLAEETLKIKHLIKQVKTKTL